MRATLPGSSLPSFIEELAERGVSDQGVSYGGEAYDAVMLTALAAVAAGTDEAPEVARRVNGLTRGGTECFIFADCADALADGADVVYAGVSGGSQFTAAGEPAVAVFNVHEFDADGRLDPDRVEELFVALPDPARGDADPSCRGTADGVLRLGTLLPETGQLSGFEPVISAAVEMAVEEINEAGGVLGRDVEVVARDSGPIGGEQLSESVDELLAAGVDAIIGPVGSSEALRVLDDVVGACVMLFSPSNTSLVLSTVDDDDLYFRTAPSDHLQARALAERIVADGHETVAVLALADDYIDEMSATAVGALHDLGVTVVEVVYDDDHAPDVADALESEPDTVLLLGFEESPDVVEELLRQGHAADDGGIYLSELNVYAVGDRFG